MFNRAFSFYICQNYFDFSRKDPDTLIKMTNFAGNIINYFYLAGCESTRLASFFCFTGIFSTGYPCYFKIALEHYALKFYSFKT